jgi:ATP-dependent Clp protease ATP-binding subunit ClpA
VDELRALVSDRHITVDLTPEARQWLAEKGFDRAFGARPMARLIERTIKKPLSEMLLFGNLEAGATVLVRRQDDGLALERS